MRTAAFLLAMLALAGCGGKSAAPATTAAAPAPRPGPGDVLYESGAWAVVVDHGHAAAEHLAGGRWTPDRSGAVKISILGPHGNAAATPQVAAELKGDSALLESALWVDGTELLEKGGGLTPKRGTIYGAPAAPLAKGPHVAVAYARTATHATAVAWSFRVV